MSEQLARLDRLAGEGDIPALGRLIQEWRRRDQHDDLRALAWRLIEEEGAPVQYMVGGQPQSLTCPTHMLLNRMNLQLKKGPPHLVLPFEVPLLWDPCRARLFAADCAEHVLPHLKGLLVELAAPLGEEFWGISELESALKAARLYAYQPHDPNWMSQERARASAVSGWIVNRVQNRARMRHFYLMSQSVVHACDAIWATWGVSMSVWKAAACAEEAAKRARNTTCGGAEEKWQARRLLKYFLGEVKLGRAQEPRPGPSSPAPLLGQP